MSDKTNSPKPPAPAPKPPAPSRPSSPGKEYRNGEGQSVIDPHPPKKK